jgi:hypothetical protein
MDSNNSHAAILPPCLLASGPLAGPALDAFSPLETGVVRSEGKGDSLASCRALDLTMRAAGAGSGHAKRRHDLRQTPHPGTAGVRTLTHWGREGAERRSNPGGLEERQNDKPAALPGGRGSDQIVGSQRRLFHTSPAMIAGTRQIEDSAGFQLHFLNDGRIHKRLERKDHSESRPHRRSRVRSPWAERIQELARANRPIRMRLVRALAASSAGCSAPYTPSGGRSQFRSQPVPYISGLTRSNADLVILGLFGLVTLFFLENEPSHWRCGRSSCLKRALAIRG